MRWETILMVLVLTIPLSMAAIDIGIGAGDGDSSVSLTSPAGPLNFSTFNVTTAEIWVTSDGNMDDIPDLYPTLDGQYVEVAGDTMTGTLHIDDAQFKMNSTYTGTAAYKGLTTRFNVSTPTGADYATHIGLDHDVSNSHAVSGAGVSLPINYGMQNILNVHGIHTKIGGSMLELNVGYENRIDRSGTLTNVASPYQIVNYGARSTVTDEVNYNSAYGGSVLTVQNVGGYFKLVQTGTQGGVGTLTKNNYGAYYDVAGATGGTTTNYGNYIAQVTGADTNYGIWDASGADWVLDGDEQGIVLGEGQDARVEFTGDSLDIDAGANDINMSTGVRVLGQFGVGGTTRLGATPLVRVSRGSDGIVLMGYGGDPSGVYAAVYNRDALNRVAFYGVDATSGVYATTLIGHPSTISKSLAVDGNTGDVYMSADNNYFYQGTGSDWRTFVDSSNNYNIDQVTGGTSTIISGNAFPVVKVVRDTTETSGYASGMTLLTDTTGSSTEGFGGAFYFALEDNSGSTEHLLAGMGGLRGTADNEGVFAVRTLSAGILKEGMRIDQNQDSHFKGNLNITGNINITGCLEYNNGGVRATLGTCI